ncbi:hypothetical protein G3I77_06430 [Streptomyces sp. D2-8]|uniref:hypothetical protein n=1 Tax=Streptomyces sp. D2-8 TaxID=2707767 RepID=UPI0020C045A8|nr:hypothetical protein [Streptomyces sp. D2-8]MCK8432691.1 hypothetical protein [Streptomyces sp. D2-8]
MGKTPPAKVGALTEQARVLSVGEMKDIADPRRTAMTVCLLAQVQAAVRDETVVMLSKRMSRHLKRAQEELLEIEKRQKETTEQLLATFRDVLTALRGSGEAAPGAWEGEASLDDLLALKNARAAIKAAGGFEAQMAELEALDAYRGSNYTALVERFFKPDRPTMFKIARRLSFTATSTDRSVLDALDHVLAHQHLTRPLVADTHPTSTDENGELVRLDLSFAPKMWLKTVYSREQPGMLVRRHFAAMVFACLVEELRCGDVAVNGAEEYGDWTRMLLPWEQCEPKLAGFCDQAGFPATASEFTVRLREALTMIAETPDFMALRERTRTSDGPGPFCLRVGRPAPGSAPAGHDDAAVPYMQDVVVLVPRHAQDLVVRVPAKHPLPQWVGGRSRGVQRDGPYVVERQRHRPQRPVRLCLRLGVRGGEGQLHPQGLARGQHGQPKALGLDVDLTDAGNAPPRDLPPGRAGFVVEDRCAVMPHGDSLSLHSARGAWGGGGSCPPCPTLPESHVSSCQVVTERHRERPAR